MSCKVVKIIRGHAYIYRNTSKRINGKVYTKSVYIGKAGDVDLRSPDFTKNAHEKILSVVTLTKPAKQEIKRDYRIAKSAKDSPYKAITDNIIAELEKGTVPWVKPWVCQMPQNGSTGRGYSGINILTLWESAQRQGFKKQQWLTFQQAKSLGGHVRKGEKGTHIVLVKEITVRDRETANEQPQQAKVTLTEDKVKTKTIKMLKGYTVFNVEQIEGLPEKFKTEPEKPVFKSVEMEKLIESTGAKITHASGDRAFYRGGECDSITLPLHSEFQDMPSYYATAFHELGHWTGHKTRLDRLKGSEFGTPEYAKEELIAELTSAFVCARLGIKGKLQHASYIENWIQVLKNDERALINATSSATKATEMILKNYNLAG